MIQRIQSVWLLLASAFAFLSMRFPFYSGHLKTVVGAQINANLNYPLAAVDSIPIVTLTVASAICSLITIFLFKDRKVQIRLTVANFIVSIIIIALYFLNIKSNYAEMGLPLVTCVFAFGIPVFLLLALRNIYRDQRLVRSMDRLR